MGSKGGSNQTSTTQSSSSPPPQVMAEYQALVNRAANNANTPYQQYPGELVAPLSNQTRSGLGGINSYANAAQPAIAGAESGTMAAGAPIAAQQFSGNAVNRYQNPYTQDVVNATQAQFNNQNQQAAQFLNSQNISSGAFGGDRAGISQAVLANQQQTAQAPVIAGLYNQAYNQALSEFNTQQGVNLQQQAFNQQQLGSMANQLGNLGTAGQNAGMQGAMAQIQGGELPQQEQQAIDTSLYNQYQQQQSYPFQTTGWLGNIIEGTGSLSGGTSNSTTTTPIGNSTSAGIGSALSGLGILGSLFSSSDARNKENINPVGKTFDGQTIYRFNYKGDPRTQIGLIAQETRHSHPDAVGNLRGMLGVDYDKATRSSAQRGHFQSGGAPVSPSMPPPGYPSGASRFPQVGQQALTLGYLGDQSARAGLGSLGLMAGDRPNYDSGGPILADYSTPLLNGQIAPWAGQAANTYNQITADTPNPAFSIDESVINGIGTGAPDLQTPYTQIPGPAVNYPAINWQNPSQDFQTAGAENSLKGLIARPGIETLMTQTTPPSQPASTPPAAQPNSDQWALNNSMLTNMEQQDRANVMDAEANGGRGSMGAVQNADAALGNVFDEEQQNNAIYNHGGFGPGYWGGSGIQAAIAGGPGSPAQQALAATLPRFFGGRVGRAAGGQLGQSGIGAALAQPPAGAMMDGQGQGSFATTSKAAGGQGFGSLFGNRQTFALGGGPDDPSQSTIGRDPFAEPTSWVPQVQLTVPGHGPPQPQGGGGGPGHGGGPAASQGGGSDPLKSLGQIGGALKKSGILGGSPAGATDPAFLSPADQAQLGQFDLSDVPTLSDSDFAGLSDSDIMAGGLGADGGSILDGLGGIGMMARGGKVRRHFDAGGDVDDIDTSWMSKPYGGHSMDYGPPPGEAANPDPSPVPDATPSVAPSAAPSAIPLAPGQKPTPLSPAGGPFITSGGKSYATDAEGRIVGQDRGAVAIPPAPPGSATPGGHGGSMSPESPPSGFDNMMTGKTPLSDVGAVGAINAGAGPAQGNVGKGGFPSADDVRSYTAQAAQRLGMDPRVAAAFVNSESSFGQHWTGDGGSSFGPLQLHYGGINPKMPNPGMGDDFTKATGLDARDPSTWQQQIDFGLSQAAKGGWEPWATTMNKLGLNAHSGIGVAPPQGGTGQGGQGVQVAQAGASDWDPNTIISKITGNNQPYFTPQDMNNPFSNKRELFNAMTMAGFAMMGGESRNPWVNIGRGGMAGMEYLQKTQALDRDWMEKQAQIEHLSHQDRVLDGDLALRAGQMGLEWKMIQMKMDEASKMNAVGQDPDMGFGSPGGGATPAVAPAATPGQDVSRAPAQASGIGAPGQGSGAPIIAGGAPPAQGAPPPQPAPNALTKPTGGGQPPLAFAPKPQPQPAAGAQPTPAQGATPAAANPATNPAAPFWHDVPVEDRPQTHFMRAQIARRFMDYDTANKEEAQGQAILNRGSVWSTSQGRMVPIPGSQETAAAGAGMKTGAEERAKVAPDIIAGQGQLAQAQAAGKETGATHTVYDAEGHAYPVSGQQWMEIARGGPSAQINGQPVYAQEPPEAKAMAGNYQSFNDDKRKFETNYQQNRSMLSSLIPIYQAWQGGRGAEEIAELSGWAKRFGLEGALPQGWQNTPAGYDTALKEAVKQSFSVLQESGAQRAPRTGLQEALLTSARPDASPAASWNIIAQGLAILDYAHDMYNSVGGYDVNKGIEDFSNKSDFPSYFKAERKQMPLFKGVTPQDYQTVTGSKLRRNKTTGEMVDPADTSKRWNAAGVPE